MGTASTIMDGNSFGAGDEAGLDERTRTLISRRDELLGSTYRLFYRNPVHLVRGSGAYVWDAEGTEYLDLYNNVPSIGHAHPRVAEAVHAQMTLLNTHTRYLHGAILDYADDLLGTLPDAIDQIMFQCTGSEANDLAIRIAREYTGGRGILVSSEAYHGNTELTSAHSPALGAGQGLDPECRLVAPPDTYRSPTGVDVGADLGERMQREIDAMRADGIAFAGFLADSAFSSDGVFTGSAGLLSAAVEVVHRNGGLFIADEVQPGFARTGDAFWGFERQGATPDIVTMGKPMGNGIPISALAARRDVLDAFSRKVPYFNTFGGNPVSIAAAQAVLDVIRDEGLQERARVVGSLLRAELDTLALTHPLIGDVRGAGQYTGLELVYDRDSREPAGAAALQLIGELRQRGVLTSVAGPHGNVLKLRPPLAFAEADIARAIDMLDAALTVVEGS